MHRSCRPGRICNQRRWRQPGDFRRYHAQGKANPRTNMTGHPPRDIREITAIELHDLIDATKAGDPDAIKRSVQFITVESFGYWHNRARAKLCRHFKNHPPSQQQCARMVGAICGRLTTGNFYEQFKDQLSMAIRFNRGRMEEAANIAL